MNLEVKDKKKETQDKAHQLLNMMFVQEGTLLDNRAYLDGYSMVTAIKTDKYMKGIKTLPNRIKIN